MRYLSSRLAMNRLPYGSLLCLALTLLCGLPARVEASEPAQKRVLPVFATRTDNALRFARNEAYRDRAILSGIQQDISREPLPPAPRDRYTWYILAAFTVMLLQTLLIASLLIERRRRRQADDDLQSLTGRLLDLQDDERRRLARDLHDVTAQNLFTINMNLSRLRRGSVEAGEVQSVLDECRHLGRQSLKEIRTLSYLLHPPMLNQAGLVDALKWYVHGFIKRSGINVDVVQLRETGRLPADVETALFRVVQESLTNISRHSGSSSAEIRLEKENDEVILQIKDHGHGFRDRASSVGNEKVSLGVGVLGMRQRLSQLGGILKIDSNSHGTVVTAVVPLTNGVSHDPHFAR
jgi:two-component system, NarL family, sensor kinase